MVNEDQNRRRIGVTGIGKSQLGLIAAAVSAAIPGGELVPIESREKGGALHIHQPDPNELAEADMRRLRARRAGPTAADMEALEAAAERRARRNAKRAGKEASR